MGHYNRRITHQKRLGFCCFNTILLSDSEIHSDFMSLNFLTICLQQFAQGPFDKHSIPNIIEYFILYKTGSVLIVKQGRESKVKNFFLVSVRN